VLNALVQKLYGNCEVITLPFKTKVHLLKASVEFDYVDYGADHDGEE